MDLNEGVTALHGASLKDQYMVSLYYAILILTGNEMAPVTLFQTVFVALLLIFGALMMAFIFGNIAAAMQNVNKKESSFQERLSFAQHTMASIKLPLPLQD